MNRVFSVIAGDLAVGYWLTDNLTSSVFRSVDKKDEADMDSLEAIELINEEKLFELKPSNFRSLKSKFPRLTTYEYENLKKLEYSFQVYMVCRLIDGREFIASVSDLEGLFYKSQVGDKTNNKQEDKFIRQKVFSVIAGDLSTGYWCTENFISPIFRSVEKKDEFDINSIEAIELINEKNLVELKRSKFYFSKSKYPKLSKYKYKKLPELEYGFVYIMCRLADGREFIASLTIREVFYYRFPVESKIMNEQEHGEYKTNNKQENKILAVMSKKNLFLDYVVEAGRVSAVLIFIIFLFGLLLKAGYRETPSTTSVNADELHSTWRCWKSLDREWETLDYGYPRSKPGGADSDCKPVK